MFGEIYVKPVNIDIFSIKFTLTLWENIALDKVHLCTLGPFCLRKLFFSVYRGSLIVAPKTPKGGS